MDKLMVYLKRGRCKCYKLQSYATCFYCMNGDYREIWLEKTSDCYSRINDFRWNIIKEKMKEAYEIINGSLFYEK